MRRILFNVHGLAVLAGVHRDGALMLAATGAALFAGGWIVTVALAIH